MLTSPPYLVPSWSKPAWVQAAVTTRAGHFNLATHVGDDPALVMANRDKLMTDLALPQPPCWLNQVHSANVIELSGEADPLLPTADASFTRHPGKVCAVLTADCLPVLLCDPKTRAVAAVHGGWRGLQAGILANTVHALQSDPADLLAWLGPAISGPCYQVGAEVYAAFSDTDPLLADAFIADGDKWQLDIAKIATIQLKSLGVHQIVPSGYCTFSQADLFFSYRRDAKKSGRMATLIWISQE